MIIGYARVSVEDQKLEPWADALTAAGAGRIYAGMGPAVRRCGAGLGRAGSQNTTPAMAAGVTNTLHDMAWLVGLIDAAAPAPKPRGPFNEKAAV